MRDLLFADVAQFRFERKFTIETLMAHQVEAILKHHPAIFSEIFYQRRVNSLYLDSHFFQNFYEHLDGVERRFKVRVRWYGELQGYIEQPILEFKLKRNQQVAKLHYPLNPFALDDKFSVEEMRVIVNKSELPDFLKEYMKSLQFSVLTTYYRKYFLAANGICRATVDTRIQAYKLFPYANHFLHKTEGLDYTVLELKYDKSQDRMIDEITEYLPFRMSRNSKYIRGLLNL